MLAALDSDDNGTAVRESSAVAKFLSQPSAYQRVRCVERIETHISWVFLTERYVYKLKKPVCFDFLDFSTPQLRYQACAAELAINRRLAPDVYLEIVPITLQTRSGRQSLQLGGEGPAIDWVVKMQRLDQSQALDELIRTGRLTKSGIETLAARLAQFYLRLPPLTIRTDEYRRDLEDHIAGNRRELLDSRHGLPREKVLRVHAAQLRTLRLWTDTIDDRVRDGRIVDGHGDLRPEHVYLTPNPKIIDAIEFNARLREVDVIDELSFLAMECTHLAPEIGGAVLQAYCRLSGDHPPSWLIGFYQSYRASVRAKVCILRASQMDGDGRSSMIEAALSYLDQAEQLAAGLGEPLLLIVRGLPGSGKSTLSELLAESLGCQWLQTDRIRREVLGGEAAAEGYNQGRYRPEQRRRVYQEMFWRAGQLLDQRVPVILDGTFSAASLRQSAVELAQEHRAHPLVVHCKCPPEVALERIAARQAKGTSLSQAEPEFYAAQQQADEPDPPGLPLVVVDTTASLNEMQQTVFTCLRAATPAQLETRQESGDLSF